MATKYWEPKATAAAQITTVQVTAYDAATTYALLVGGITIATSVAAGSANAVATALAAAWEASAHIYATGVTATSATDTVTLTADVAEVPFTVTTSVTGGSGTLGSVTESTAPTGPHTLDEPQNWSGEALPSNDDVLILRDSDIDIAWGLDGLTTTGHELRVEQSYTGAIGLDWSGVATTADGQTTNSAAPEYRQTYLQLDISRLVIGGHIGTGDPGGSQRIMIDNDRGSASQTVVFQTSFTSTELGKPPVRLKFAHANADIDIRSGIVGVAVDIPGETSTIGDVVMRAGQFHCGDGVTMTNYTQHAGQGRLTLGAATLTQALVHGGRCVIDGDQAVTTVKMTDGEVVANTTGTITNVTHAGGGTIDFTQSSEARTVTNYNADRGGSLVQDEDVLTITNFNLPDGPSTLNFAA